jgi:peptide chain release factor 3
MRDDVRAELEETGGDGARWVAEVRSDGVSRRAYDAGLFRLGVAPLSACLELLARLAANAPPPRVQKAKVKGQPRLKWAGAQGSERLRLQDSSEHGSQPPRPVAFFRISSGKFQRGMTAEDGGGQRLQIVHNPMMFMAQDREIAQEAFPRRRDRHSKPWRLRVGDSLSQSGDVQFQGIPNFAPEILRRVRVKDPMKQKHLRKALEGWAKRA